MRQKIFIEYNPEVIAVMPPLPGGRVPVPILSDLKNPPELIRWRKHAIDQSIQSAIDLLNQKGGPQDIVIGGMYVLKNVERINNVYPTRDYGGEPGFLCIEFEQAIYA